MAIRVDDGRTMLQNGYPRARYALCANGVHPLPLWMRERPSLASSIGSIAKPGGAARMPRGNVGPPSKSLPIATDPISTARCYLAPGCTTGCFLPSPSWTTMN